MIKHIANRCPNLSMFSLSSAKPHSQATDSQVTEYTRRGKHRPKIDHELGTKIGTFELKEKSQYTDFEILHKKYFSSEIGVTFDQFECDSEKNTFSFLFETPQDLPAPAVSYALEKYLNAGGSKSYPVRNLLSEMQLKSFNSAPQLSTVTDDYICFSFQTNSMKDFENLLEVYTDMIFQPLLREEDFKELIWRYELNRFDSNRLTIRGSLAEEMLENCYYEELTIYHLILRNMFRPKGKEAHLSICSAEDLRKLKYEDVLQFYKQTITLGNLKLINHGDLDSNWLLQKFQEKVDAKAQKSHFRNVQPSKSPQLPTLPKQAVFEHLKQPQILLLSFRIDQNELEKNPEEKSLLSILSYLLFEMPDSPFMKFNSPETPYPSLYGFKSRYFNIGVSYLISEEDRNNPQQRKRAKVQKQSEIRETLSSLVDQKINPSLVEQCLMHLEANYFTEDGSKITENVIEDLVNAGVRQKSPQANSYKMFDQTLKVSSTISDHSMSIELLKRIRKEPIFQKLIQKYLVDNRGYLVLEGRRNYELVENEQWERRKLFTSIAQALSPSELEKLTEFRPASEIQDARCLPVIQPNEIQFFEDTPPTVEDSNGVKLYHQPFQSHVKLTLKIDISDLSDEDLPLIELMSKSFTKMGIKSMKVEAYSQVLSKAINKIDLRYETQKASFGSTEMKIYLFLEVEFNDRNFEAGFSLVDGFITDFNSDNIFELSKAIQKASSDAFHSISENLVTVHGTHLAASKSPYAFFESQVFKSRAVTEIAAEIKKVNNPKDILYSIASHIRALWTQVMEKSRVQILLECKQSKRSLYSKYVSIITNSIARAGQPISTISTLDFPTQKWLKYFPGFEHQQLAFEVFKFPYFEKQSAASFVYSSIVNSNINKFNRYGGCFLYKGALVSYIEGNRKKVIELEDHYKRIENIDDAKRNIFRNFGRYTTKEYFQSGIGFEQARHFKEALVATEKHEIEEVMDEYIFKVLKQGESSVLCLGPQLPNYEPLIRKGWEIERSVDDVSLKVESLTAKSPTLRLEDFTRIC